MCMLFSFLWPETQNSALIRSLLIVYYMATAVAVLYTWKHYVRRAYCTDWFDVSKSGLLNKLSWKPDIARLMNDDPLTHTPVFRLGLWHQALRDLACLALASGILIAGIRGITILGASPTKDNVEIATFLIGFLSLAGAATKVTYEWRLKARSENRQRWIDQMREALSLLIMNVPKHSDTVPEKTVKNEVDMEQHGKLELLMNPSEKDHQALMALIRHIHGHDGIPIDHIPRTELGFATLVPSNSADRSELKSQMMRLSNVVLKREWERVKRIQ
jgi:hypothetical protein